MRATTSCRPRRRSPSSSSTNSAARPADASSNRAWWHTAYQRSHISQGSTASGVVPLAQERAGVFTTQIFDPLTTRANPAGSGSIRDPFPNNTIPAARFDKLGKNLVDRYPDPNTAGSINYFNNPLGSTRTHNATVRGDLRISDKDTVFARWSLDQAALLPCRCCRSAPRPE